MSDNSGYPAPEPDLLACRSCGKAMAEHPHPGCKRYERLEPALPVDPVREALREVLYWATNYEHSDPEVRAMLIRATVVLGDCFECHRPVDAHEPDCTVGQYNAGREPDLPPCTHEDVEHYGGGLRCKTCRAILESPLPSRRPPMPPAYPQTQAAYDRNGEWYADQYRTLYAALQRLYVAFWDGGLKTQEQKDAWLHAGQALHPSKEAQRGD